MITTWFGTVISAPIVDRKAFDSSLDSVPTSPSLVLLDAFRA